MPRSHAAMPAMRARLAAISFDDDKRRHYADATERHAHYHERLRHSLMLTRSAGGLAARPRPPPPKRCR